MCNFVSWLGEGVEVSVRAGQTGTEVQGGGQLQTPGATHKDGVKTKQRDRGKRECRTEKERARDSTHWSGRLLPTSRGDAVRATITTPGQPCMGRPYSNMCSYTLYMSYRAGLISNNY